MIRSKQLDKRLSETERIEAESAAHEPVDLAEVGITGMTAAERSESFLSQTSDPYCYKVGKTTVHISFAPDAAPLEDKLRAYFMGLKQKAFGAQTNP